MSRPTPGPWVAQKDPNSMLCSDWVIGIENGPIDYVAVCDEHNARLIAAAPELLDALKTAGLFLHHCWCDVQMNDYSFEKLQETMSAIDAVIAKAVQP